MNPEGVPTTREPADWFCQRSTHIAQSGYVMNSGWFDATRAGTYLAPNLVAEAARTLGAPGDTVRRALAAGGLRDGHRIGDLDIAVAIASSASGIDPETLRERANDPDTESRVRASTEAFHATGATQRPTFVVTRDDGDLAVMAGFYRSAPLIGAIDAMLADARAYRAYAEVHGDPPAACPGCNARISHWRRTDRVRGFGDRSWSGSVVVGEGKPPGLEAVAKRGPEGSCGGDDTSMPGHFRIVIIRKEEECLAEHPRGR